MTKGTFCATPFLVDLLKKKIIQEEYDCCCTHLRIHVCDLSFPYSNIFYQAIVDLDNKIICMNGNNSWPPVVGKKIRKIGQHQKKIDIDTHTHTTELKTQLYKMTDLRNNL
jgi:hypothetical protein